MGAHSLSTRPAIGPLTRLVAQLAIEFCDAGSCLDVIRKLGRPFTEKQIRSVMRQVVSGVAYIHGVTPPICHRDIKAGNILLNGKGEAKIGTHRATFS